MRALSLKVYRCKYMDENYDPTNGGISGRYDEILVPCDEGWREYDPYDPPENLFEVVARAIMGSVVLDLVPVTRPDGMVGPMFGGNYATTSDSRWGQMLAKRFGSQFRFNNCVHILDRFETWEQYEVLSR